MDNLTRGRLGELIVVKQLLKHGFEVALPFGHQPLWDLIFKEGASWMSAQVKIARTCPSGKLSARVVRDSGRMVRKLVHYSATDVDFIVAVDPESECVWRYRTPLSSGHISPTSKDIWLHGFRAPGPSSMENLPTGPIKPPHVCKWRARALNLSVKPAWMDTDNWDLIQKFSAGYSYKQLAEHAGIRLDSMQARLSRAIGRATRQLSIQNQA